MQKKKLYISPAFDPVDYNSLLGRMSSMFGTSNSALDWFKSCLSKRSFTVLIDDAESEHKLPTCGITQGAVLAVLLFAIFIQNLYEKS